MKLLIVDDDDQIREGMTYGIQWDTLGIQQVESCKNGREALDVLQREYFDIVITDISMPVFDGVQLMQEVRKTNTETAFILISGYKEFEYVKAGLTYGAEDYILKPIHLDELIKIVMSTIKKIESRQTDQHNRVLVDNMERKNRLQEVIGGKEKNVQTIKEILQENGITEKVNMLLCALLKLEDNRASEEMKTHITAYAAEWLAGYSYCIWETEKRELFLIVNTPDSALRILHLQQRLQKMLQDMNEGQSLCCSMGISEIGNPEDLSELYRNAGIAFQEQWFVGIGKTMFCKDVEKRRQHAFGIEQLNEQMKNYVEEGNRQELEKFLKECEQEFVLCPKNEVCDLVIKNLMYVVQKIEKTDLRVEAMEKAYVDTSYEEVMANWRQRISEIFQSLHENREYSKEIRQALQYIKKHYMEKIAVEDVAEQLELSAGYFSRMFKQQTGTTFLKYLNNYRIEKAKTLLLTTNLKVYEVGEQVGISDYFYFTQLFRSITGTSPKKIRNEK